MISWINLGVLLVSAFLCIHFYVKSVSPAALEKKIGITAYRHCYRFRIISSIFMATHFVAYGVYYFYPLPLGIPRFFPWDWSISALIALVIAIPSGYLLFLGGKAAKRETLEPRKEYGLYGGIYNKIRHPQAVGELPLAWVIAFLLHSPFLALFSFLWIPLFYIMCWAEEKDLAIRYGEEYLKYKKNTGFIIPKRHRKSQ